MRKRTTDLVKLATEAFKEHQLVLSGSDRWRIARFDVSGLTGMYATEIISLWGRRLYVGGDIDDCVFGYYSGGPTHFDKLKWIGRTTDLDGYVWQKAKIGMTDNGKITSDGRGNSRGPNARVIYAWAAVRRLCDLLLI